MLKFFSKIAFLFIPSVTLAATINTSRGFSGLVSFFVDFIQRIIYFIFALAFIVFLWGVIKYFIVGGGDANSVKEGKRFVFSGIIGFCVMFLLWGIVRLLQNTFLGG